MLLVACLTLEVKQLEQPLIVASKRRTPGHWRTVMPHWTMRCLDLQGKACDVRLLDALTPETSALLGPL